jgi:hypothetical protein
VGNRLSTLATVQRRTVATVFGTVALTAACGAGAIAVNLSILHRTPPDPIGRLTRQVHVSVTTAP